GLFVGGCSPSSSDNEMPGGVALAAELEIEATETVIPTTIPSATPLPATATISPTHTPEPTVTNTPTTTPIPLSTAIPTVELEIASLDPVLTPIIGQPIQAIKMFVNCGDTRTEYRFRGNRSGNEIPACGTVTEMWAYGLQPGDLISLGTIAFSRDVTYKRLDGFEGGIAIFNPNSPIPDTDPEPSTIVNVLCDGSTIAIIHFFGDGESAQIAGPCAGLVTVEGEISSYGIVEYTDADYSYVYEVVSGEALEPVGFPIIFLYGEYNDNYNPAEG
ncbi:hypothetical protein KC571_02575, partial [candidate division WWE3 bacterium]|nr:hypothetical protein [candidate division WWE3 bacterium]